MVSDTFIYSPSYVIQVTALGTCCTPGFPWLQKSQSCDRHHNKGFYGFNVYENAWYVSDVTQGFHGYEVSMLMIKFSISLSHTPVSTVTIQLSWYVFGFHGELTRSTDEWYTTDGIKT